MLYLVTTVASAGMFHAAATFLPSTFAMYTSMLGTAAFVDRRRGFRTAEGVFWFALGGLLGWPFSMAMCVPHVVEELFMASVSWGALPTVKRLIKGGIASGLLLVGSTPTHRISHGNGSERKKGSLVVIGWDCRNRLLRISET